MTNQEEAMESSVLNPNDQLRVVEAILFASSDPVDKKTLIEKLPKNADLDLLLDRLDNLYKDRGLELRKIGNKFMFKTSSDLTFIMQREAKSQRKLSKAAIETLAIIAYHQPVTRAEIEEIRGVSVSSGTIDSLLQMNWVKINGRRRVPGNPLAYGTTEEFLVHFDLENIKDLPEMQELKSMGLLDSNLPPDLYPENTINNNSIDEINDINTIEDSGEK
ncbi:MAG: SMC-Scp complex subunit ScpB [Rhodobiaceae bacterium]|nr:SMC-Scp complex subunit ScpB [Rhodobiaceae bacterium]